MNRRSFLKSLAAGVALPHLSRAALPKAKITRVRIYRPPNLNPTINQSNMLVTVETDIGITGVGEGGTKDLLEQCAGSLIGKDPFQIEKIWQHMYIDYFYPPGREKVHALGALDLALWDIKGKAFQAPVHQLLGGMARNHVECYGVPRTAPGPGAGQRGGGGFVNELAGPDRVRELARASMEAGFRCFRMDASVGGPITDRVFNTRERVRLVAEACKAAREGVGPKGDWMIDFHQKFDYSDAARACKLIEEYDPYMVEDPVRDEHAHQDLPKLRQVTTVPLGHGEEWGQRYDFNKLVENHDIDYARCTLPNVGGITEMLKIMALCETHAVGIVPHFTGPVATAALVHSLGTFSGPVLVEIGANQVLPAYLPECHDFKNGKLWPNERPGLGVTVDFKALQMVGEVTQPGMSRIYYRPDGSLTHW
jgi:L-alanine-DL-glutamate epimerase-like enolase superfamily enzyme